MENQFFVSMLGAGSVQQERESKSSTATDSRAFSSCLDEAASGKENSNNQLISEKETAKQAAERQKAAKADAQAQAKAAQVKAFQNPRMGSKAFLYDMMYRNPDTLSMAEKQALKLDTAAKSGAGLPTQQTKDGKGKTGAASQNGVSVKGENDSKGLLQADTKNQGKVKEDTGKMAKSEAGQAASASSKAASSEKGVSDNVAINNAAKTEEAHKTQQAARTEKRQQVIDQIVTHMEIRNFANRDELQLRLNPEYLGELKIKLVKNEDGELSAQFITDSEETSQILQESRSELRTNIEKKGMRLSKIDVEFNKYLN